jgi:hypothetical protein
MKKALIFVLFVLSSFLVKAQGIGFCIGPKIGYNSNTLIDNLDSIQTSMQNSFQFGAFLRIGSKFYFQPEANYQVVSGTLNKSAGVSVQSQDYTLKSIKMPAILGYKLINKGIFNFRILAGPVFTFAIDKQVDPSDMGSLWPLQSADDLKNSAWSVQTGAGLDVLFMTLDVRYEIGVDNLYSGSDDLTLKNNMFNVSLGIKFL